MTKNKWKTSFLISLLLLVASNGFWVYATIDQAVSYSYLSDSYAYVSDAKHELGKLIVQGAAKYDLGQDDILHLLRQADPDAFIVEEGNSILTKHSKFAFDQGKLSYVE